MFGSPALPFTTGCPLRLVDGLNEEWEREHEGELGDNSTKEICGLSDAPFAIRHLNNTQLGSFGGHDHGLQSVREEETRKRLESELLNEQPEEDVNVDSEMQEDDDGTTLVRSLWCNDFRKN